MLGYHERFKDIVTSTGVSFQVLGRARGVPERNMCELADPPSRGSTPGTERDSGL